jgi:hypothetical protein
LIKPPGGKKSQVHKKSKAALLNNREIPFKSDSVFAFPKREDNAKNRSDSPWLKGSVIPSFVGCEFSTEEFFGRANPVSDGYAAPDVPSLEGQMPCLR